MDVKKAAAETKDYIVSIRREFHRHPELSLQEFRTAQRIEEELDKFGIPHTRVGETGVLGTLKGAKDNGKVLVLRADIDALPIEETHECVYRSENAGVMHACGHDAHAACLLGAAKILSENRDAFSGKVRLVFQPGEEIGKGAKPFVAAGVLDGAERVFGLHTAYDLEAGTVGLKPGINNAAVDHFRIRVHGKSTHVSTPHLGVDALYIASQIVVAVQGLVTRRTSPTEPVIIGIGKLNAGTTYNAVAAFAEMEGTTRTISQESRDRVRAQVSETAQSIAALYGGTAEIAENVDLDIADGEALLSFVHERNIGLVVIGPEAPLVDGVADLLRADGVPVFGPNADGAQLEGSKAYSKEFMMANDIPTAAYGRFDNEADALAYVREQGAPIVIKADGLAAGKGVVVAETVEDAEAAVRACFDGAFGDAGATVVIEECMTGPECSLLCFVTAGQSFPMAPAQDHKRAYDGDLGPNTGGMGVYSPVPIVTDEEMAAMVAIMEKAAAATAREPFASDYRGTLYGGFMLTPEGPKIVEFNVRFGDPETQVVLPRLESDLVEVMLAVAEGRPEDVQLEWSDDWAVSVVLASEGYPGSYEKGKVILGIEEAEELPGVTVFHAGTRRNYDGELLTNGGRVLNVVAKGDSFEEARERAYEACDLINFEGKMYRHDIGKKALQGRSAWDQ